MGKEINEMDNYNVLCQIGKGACGAVYLVRKKESKKLAALKKIQLDESRKTRTKEAVQREANIMSKLKHPHIVTYHTSFFDETQEYLCIVLDYCDGGTLDDKIKDALRKNKHLPEKQIIHWFLQIAMAVRYLHNNKVLHRDLKCENVFLNKSGSLCKLGDFGIAKSMDTTIEKASTCVGTPCYLSPEMCQDIPYSSKSDIWALGCMLYEMLSLKPAFDANNLVSLFYKIVRADFEPIPDVYSEDMENLIAMVLVKSPENRPSARGVLAIPFLRAELLKFIKEKENELLQFKRLPTREGTRPYSTPNLSRLHSDPGEESNLMNFENLQEKRAISCKPTMISRSQEKSQLSSATPGSGGRVSTIPEENEEQAIERTLRLERIIAQGQLLDKPRGEPTSPTKHRPISSLESEPKTKIKPIRKEIKENELRLALEKLGDSPVESMEESPKSPTSEKNKDKLNDKEEEGETDMIMSPHKTDENSQSENRKSPEKVRKKSTGKSDNDTQSMRSPEPQKKQKLQESEEKTKNSKQTGTKTPVPHGSVIDSPRISRAGSKTPRAGSKTPTSKAKTPGLDSSRKTKTQETQKTPRAVGPPPPINIQQDKTKAAKNKISSKSTTDVSLTKRRNSDGKSTGTPDKNRRQRKESGQGKRRAIEKSADTLRVPPENLDYYSDDFDDSSSGSEIEEEIPEEITEGKAFTNEKRPSLTQTFEIPEIPEDLVDGKEADDSDEDFYEGEEVEEIEEELDDVINVAKEAHENLDPVEHESDETFVDNVVVERVSTAKFIREQCMDALGEEKYEKIKNVCENNEMEPLELKKLEKIVGKENMKTFFLMNEVLTNNKDQE